MAAATILTHATPSSPWPARLSAAVADDSDADDLCVDLSAPTGFLSSLRTNLRLVDAAPPPPPALQPFHLVAAPDRSSKHQRSKLLSSLSVSTSYIVNNLVSHHTSSSSLHSHPSSGQTSPVRTHSRSGSSSSSSIPLTSSQQQQPPTRTASFPHQQQDDELPDGVTIRTAHGPEETSQALSLVRQTITTQSLTAFKSLVLHPLNLALTALALLTIQHFVLHCPALSYRTVFLAWAIFLSALLAAALICSFIPYSDLSHSIDDAWLGQDELLVAVRPPTPSTLTSHPLTRLFLQNPALPLPSAQPAEVIGVLAFRTRATTLSESSSSSTRSSGKRTKRGPGRACIRAWAVRWDARGRGVGSALLKAAVTECGGRRGSGAVDGVGFASQHAHAERVLPDLYNRPFQRRDRWAHEALLSAVQHRAGSCGADADGVVFVNRAGSRKGRLGS